MTSGFALHSASAAFTTLEKEALSLAKVKPLVIDYDDPEFSGSGERLGTVEYEQLVAEGDADFAWRMPGDEWDAVREPFISGLMGPVRLVFYKRIAVAPGFDHRCARDRVSSRRAPHVTVASSALEREHTNVAVGQDQNR